MSSMRSVIFREIVVVLVLSLVVVSSLSIKTVDAQAGQVTLKPSDDTYVDSSNPGSNYGGQIYLEISEWNVFSAHYDLMAWLKFDLSSVPDGAVVDGATLSLYTPIVGETFNVHAYAGSAFLNASTVTPWTELTLTYSNMPSYNTTSMDSVLVATANLWYNWSVVAAVRNALNDNPKSVTLVMREPTLHSSATSVYFYSKENPVTPTDYSPKLTIHWSNVVPEFPTFLILPLFMMATLLALVFHKRAPGEATQWLKKQRITQMERKRESGKVYFTACR